MAKIDEKFIVNLQGKEFVLYNGLIDLAHQEGLISIEVELLQFPSNENDNTAIAKATAKTKDKIFTDIGDANTKSVGKMLIPHIIRMASTRAKARALRDLTNVGMTAVEEMGGEDHDATGNKGDNDKHEHSPTNPLTNNKSEGQGLASEKQLGFIYKLVKDKDYGSDSISKYIKTAYNKNSSKELTTKEASQLIKMLNEIK